jgi:AcrR family transcriptional regulator
MARPRRYDPDLADRIVDAAGRLLMEEGPHALTTRKVVQAAATTTNALYTLIGGKPELLRAMYLAGFRRLAAHLDAVPADLAPLDRLAQLGEAYLDSAFANPHLYSLMFERPVPEFEPDVDDMAEALSTLQVLMDEVARCIDAGVLPQEPSADDQAMAFWAVSHGACSLVIAGMLREEWSPEQRHPPRSWHTRTPPHPLLTPHPHPHPRPNLRSEPSSCVGPRRSFEDAEASREPIGEPTQRKTLCRGRHRWPRQGAAPLVGAPIGAPP